MKAKISKDFTNEYGEFKKGSECMITRVWINSKTNDIYAQLITLDKRMTITNLKNVEY